MTTTKKIRKDVIAVLDKYDCWEHVIINYICIAKWGHGPMGLKADKHGNISRTTRNGRMINDLHDAIDKPVDMTWKGTTND